MRINRLETHDRLQHFVKDQAINIWKGAEDCLKKNPLSLALQDKSPYIYIFAHPRTEDDGVTKKLYWQPRLSKPLPQSNSYLFRATSKTDQMEICWLIPSEELWDQYKKGKVTQSDIVDWSIQKYKYDRITLERADPDDHTEEKGREILRQVIEEHKQSLKYIKLTPEAEFLIPSE